MDLGRRRFIRILASSSSLLLPQFSFGENKPANSRIRHWNNIVLGTNGKISLYGNNEDQANATFNECLKEIIRLEKLFSLFDQTSAVSKLNKFGYLTNPPPEFVYLIKKAIKFSVLTSGAFDISIQPLWKYYSEWFQNNDSPPPKNEVHTLKNLIDYRKIHVSENIVSFDQDDMAISFNGIAQGYITDKISKLLKNKGYEHVLVELGEKYAIGSHPSKSPWQIGIKHPKENGLMEIIPINNRALATSGGYGTPFEPSSKYHHILNPNNGNSPNHVLSSSVLAPTALEADALSTAFSILPIEVSKKIILKKPFLSGIFLTKNNQVIKI